MNVPAILTGLLSEFWTLLADMAPYLLLGFLVAGLLYVWISPRMVERHLGGKGLLPILKAALFGIPLPLCSCGVIPVSASLRKQGASRGATTAFLLSTPETGVDSIFVTFSLLGIVFAIFKPVAALFTGLVGGWLVTLLAEDEPAVAREDLKCNDRCCAGEEDDACGPDGAGEPRGGKLRRALIYGFITLPRDIGPSLLVGLLIAGVITVAVPADFFAGVLSNRFAQMLVMMLFGIPIYVCATASVPVAAALMAKGVSPGAALVFLMTGPATNAATVAMVWNLMGRRTAVIYLATIALCALASGLVLDSLFTIPEVAAAAEPRELLPAGVEIASILVLVAVLAGSFYEPLVARFAWVRRAVAAARGARSLTLLVEGMTCAHCARSVRGALGGCRGVEATEVDFKSGTARVTGRHLDIECLRGAVEGLGFKIVGPPKPGDS